MSGVAGSISIVAARTISGLSGYVVLAVAANSLSTSQFSELALYQTVIFLLQIAFDTGLVHLANREAAGSADWQALSARFQGIRLTAHLMMGLLLLAMVILGVVTSQDPWLPVACALALVSNALNLDWVLICRQEQGLWARKVIIVGLTNVVVAATLLTFLKQPSAVLAGVFAMNAAGWLYLRCKGWATAMPKPMRPNASESLIAAQLSTGAILLHTGYNATLLMATSWMGGVTAAAYACIYRAFSASTMFVPPVVEFSVSREIARMKGTTPSAPRGVFLRLLATSVALVSPVLLMPSAYLHALFSSAIDLAKFQIVPADLNMLKIALLLYCFDFCSQRTAYILDRRRLLLSASTAGLLACAVVSSLILAGRFPPTSQSWFYPLFAYQATTSLALLMALMSRGHSVPARHA